ncbi:fimbrillin family protein [Parabacteroides bouchesdurhonensis]|uniref:fimbrillin family protein n=1 Tax=Parabacteroides bouchesdurhonensis TaxID=1936995 RepID=UPI000C84F307|nr:fimbrillin family protein [Parabacteroides bouchesdurhonensis]
MKKLLLFMILTAGIYSCSGDNCLISIDSFEFKEKPLQIYTKVLTTKSPNLIQEFTNGAIIGLHVTSGNVGEVYRKNIDYKNVKSTAYLENSKICWKQEPDISLNSEITTVYAYYPYQPQTDFNATHIPVKISPDATQTDDYMYGTLATGQKSVNNMSPIALLTMNHALSLISFEVKTDIKADSFLLNGIQLGNKAGGNKLYSEGTMDIASGTITGSTGICSPTKLTTESPIQLTTTHCRPIQIMVIPTNNIIEEGDIEALFFINNKTYRYLIPTNTEWQKGYKYQYKLTFNGNSLLLDKILIDNWIPKEENNISKNFI